jgi:hypothetical protein
MTAVFYPDCKAVSPNGHFLIEARSPHNGTISHRDGTPASDQEFAFKYREHQSDFRYRLIDKQTDQVVWERWQDAEDSPHELIVSNHGWSIIRTHGFQPEVIAVSPAGHDRCRVRIVGEEFDSSNEVEKVASSWLAQRAQFTTAGVFWTGYSWPYFYHKDTLNLFVCRTWWGKRLVIDLDKGCLINLDDQSSSDLPRAFMEHESASASELLSSLSSQMKGIHSLLASKKALTAKDKALREQIMSVRSAILLVGDHRLVECADLLKLWEPIDYPSYSTGSNVLGKHWVEAQFFRPQVQHVLRLLEIEPQGYAPYFFTRYDQRLKIPECVEGRIKLTKKVVASMSPMDVLGLLGTPDYLLDPRHTVDGQYVPVEIWEYDHLVEKSWRTFRIVWKAGIKRSAAPKMQSAAETPAAWINSKERELALYGLW